MGWRNGNLAGCTASNPTRSLKDVLERLPTTTNQQVAQLTPLNWKKARQSELKQAA